MEKHFVVGTVPVSLTTSFMAAMVIAKVDHRLSGCLPSGSQIGNQAQNTDKDLASVKENASPKES